MSRNIKRYFGILHCIVHLKVYLYKMYFWIDWAVKVFLRLFCNIYLEHERVKINEWRSIKMSLRISQCVGCGTQMQCTSSIRTKGIKRKSKMQFLHYEARALTCGIYFSHLFLSLFVQLIVKVSCPQNYFFHITLLHCWCYGNYKY